MIVRWLQPEVGAGERTRTSKALRPAAPKAAASASSATPAALADYNIACHGGDIQAAARLSGSASAAWLGLPDPIYSSYIPSMLAKSRKRRTT